MFLENKMSVNIRNEAAITTQCPAGGGRGQQKSFSYCEISRTELRYQSFKRLCLEMMELIMERAFLLFFIRVPRVTYIAGF